MVTFGNSTRKSPFNHRQEGAFRVWPRAVVAARTMRHRSANDNDINRVVTSRGVLSFGREDPSPGPRVCSEKRDQRNILGDAKSLLREVEQREVRGEKPTGNVCKRKTDRIIASSSFVTNITVIGIGILLTFPAAA